MKQPILRTNTTRYTLICDVCRKPAIQPGAIYYIWVGADICAACYADIRPGEEVTSS